MVEVNVRFAGLTVPGVVPLDPGEEVLGGPPVGLGHPPLRGHGREEIRSSQRFESSPN